MANKEASLLIKIKEAGSEVLDKINAKTLLIGASVAVIAKQLFDFGKAAFNSYAEQELAVNKLNQSLVQQGIYTAALSKEYQSWADAMQMKSQFNDEEIVASQATLQSYLGQTKITKELMQATLDLAAAKGMNLTSAAEMVGKAIGTNTNALARQGIELSANASKSEKLAAVTAALTGKFGGQAAAAVQGANSTQLMWKALGELQELIGSTLAPIITLVAQKIMQMAMAVKEATWIWEGMHYAMLAISSVFSVIEMSVKTSIGMIIQQFQTAGALIKAIISGDLAAIPNIISNHFAAMKERVVSNVKTMVTDVEGAYKKHQNAMQGMMEGEKQRLEQTEQRKTEIIKEQAIARQMARDAEIAEEQKKRDEAFAKEREDFALKSEEEIMRMEVERQIRADADAMEKLEALNRQIAYETDRTAVIQAEEEKRLLLKQFYDKEQAKLDEKRKIDKKKKEEEEQKEKWARMDATEKFEAMMDDKKMKRATETMSYLTKMQDSKHKELVAIGKAAAIATIAIDTARAVMGVWGWAAALGPFGPPIAAALTAAIVGYGAEQVARVNSAQMAEGGIVKARPGGMLATIGEGGRDEAVIPLENGTVPGMGSTINLTINGGFLGDEASARELMVAIDKEFLRLRQSNQSLAFDEGVI